MGRVVRGIPARPRPAIRMPTQRAAEQLLPAPERQPHSAPGYPTSRAAAHLQPTAKARLAGRRRPRACPVLPSREEPAAAARVQRRCGCGCGVVGVGRHWVVPHRIRFGAPVRRAAPAAAPARAKRPKRACCCCCCVGRVKVAAAAAPPAAHKAGAGHGHRRRLEASLQAGGRRQGAAHWGRAWRMHHLPPVCRRCWCVLPL